MLNIMKMIRLFKIRSGKTKSLIIALPFLICFIASCVIWVFKYSLPLKHDGATFYLLDYNFYYGTRIFIGSIYTLLMKHISEDFIFAMNIAAYVAFVSLFMMCLSVSLKKSAVKYNPVLSALVPCFLICPYSILQFSGWIGSYDIWLGLAMIVCCLAAENKTARWFIPVICTVAVFTHYAFVFSFYPAVVCVQLLLIFKKDNKQRAGDIISSVITFLCTFLSAVWCAFFAQSTIKMTEQELFTYMSDRLGDNVGNQGYIASYYFDKNNNIDMLSGLLNGVDTEKFTRENLFFFLPFFLLISAIWIGCIIKSKRKTDRFKYLVFIGAFIVSSSVMFFMIEPNRWRAAAIISQIVILCICLKEDDEPVTVFFESINKSGFALIPLALAFYSLHILMTIEPHNYH